MIWFTSSCSDQYNLFLLSDTAQSPGSKSFDAFTGCHADIGGFSLNYHKHIHCGEGGLIVTNDDSLASRMRLIRNHGEAVIDSSSPDDLSNIIGYNFRLGEIEAAIARQQFSQLNFYIDSRIHVANQLTKGLSELPGLKLPFVSEFTSHVYYVYGMLIDTNLLPFDREWIVSALRAEGVQSLYPGYTCVHRYPLYQQKVAFGPSVSRGLLHRNLEILNIPIMVYVPLPRITMTINFLALVYVIFNILQRK